MLAEVFHFLGVGVRMRRGVGDVVVSGHDVAAQLAQLQP
jgi:hypothetical protein